MRFSAVTVLICLVGLCASAAPTVERKVYAHYMGCFPAHKCNEWIRGWFDKGLKEYLRGENPEDYCAYLGGRFDGPPLVPADYNVDAVENSKMEIRRAIRAGIDGFAVDAWAGDHSPEFMDSLFQAAEELGVDFGVTICFDNACHGAKWITGTDRWERFVCSAHRVLDKHINSPNMARFHGKPLFFGYGSAWIVDFEKGESEAALRGRVKEAWTNWRKALPCEVYLHGCIGKFVNYHDFDANDWAGIARDCAATFDTIGSFLGTENEWGVKSPLWEYAKKAGCGWSQPLFWQYSNKAGGIITDTGLEHLHRNWKLAIARGSELMQFVTWNDYGEETSLAPNLGGNYTVTRINRWYADLWKTGREPAVEKDEVHVAFRKTAGDALSYPFLARRVPLAAELEVVTFLKEKSVVQVKDYGTYEAPKGMCVRRFPLKPGLVAARVRRNDRTVCDVLAPERVSSRRWREDMTTYAYGSNFDEEWNLDFPGVKPPRNSEMGDDDGDGLPNWFEMVYFGKFADQSTAGVADPKADPDGDGFTNLQEWENETNPLVADTPYARGFVWSLARLREKSPYFGNPARDAKDRYVWRFAYRFGAENERYESGLPEPFAEIESGGGSLRNGGFHIYLPNPKQGNRRVAGFDTGIVFNDRTNGTAVVRVHRDTPIAVEWKSPVNGDVAYAFAGDTSADNCVCEVIVELNGKRLSSATVRPDREGVLSIRPTKVRKGDVIRTVITTETPGTGRYLRIKDISLTLKRISAR